MYLSKCKAAVFVSLPWSSLLWKKKIVFPIFWNVLMDVICVWNTLRYSEIFSYDILKTETNVIFRVAYRYGNYIFWWTQKIRYFSASDILVKWKEILLLWYLLFEKKIIIDAILVLNIILIFSYTMIYMADLFCVILRNGEIQFFLKEYNQYSPQRDFIIVWKKKYFA